MKKLVSVLLAIAILLPMFNIGAAAYDASSMHVWDGTADTSWYTGSSDSYDISTPEQLAGLAQLVNNGKSMSGVVINLTADLLMNDNPGEWEDWDEFPPQNEFTAIGFTNTSLGGQPFMGAFNGQGHTISGLYTNGEYGGLFGYISGAIIANVRIYESCLKSKRHGPQDSFAGGVVALGENCYISCCEVNSCFVGAMGPSSNDGMHRAAAGGILGSAETVNISAIAGLITFGVATGMIVNPAITEGAAGGSIASGVIDSCKVVGTSVKSKSNFGDAFSGGIIGYGHTGMMYDSFYDIAGGAVNAATNNFFSGTKYGLVAGQLFNYHLENVYYYNFDNEIKTWGVGSYERGMFEQKDTSVGKTRNELKSAAFADELGEAFAAVGGDYPKLTVMGDMPKFKDSGVKRLDAPENVVADPDDHFITFTWDKVKGADKYILRYSTDREKWLIKESKTNTCVVDGLTPKTYYYYSVQAVQNGINGRSSRVYKDDDGWHGRVETIRERQPAPTNVICTKKGTNSLKIEWDGPLSFDRMSWGGTNYYYSVGISTDKKNWTYHNNSKYDHYDVKNLTPNTKYYFTIALYDHGIMGNYSKPAAFTTEKLPAPANVSGKKTNTTLKVSWDAVTGAEKYKIGISTDNKNWTYKTVKSTTYTFRDLKSGKKYYYKVTAVVGNTANKWSNPRTVTLPKK